MIKIGLKNISILSFLNRIPVVKFFFVLKITKGFVKIENQAVLDKFYRDIFVNSKISKRTLEGRFADLDNITVALLQNQKNINLHDVAVSSGITSVDLYNRLHSNGMSLSFFVSDKYAEFFVKKGFVKRVFDNEKQFVFGYYAFFFGVDKNLNFPLTMWLFRKMRKIPIPKQFDYKILLFHPKLQTLINNKQVNYIDYDILATKTELKFSFIRCMNILNFSYFSDAEIKQAVANIYSSLHENGILLVGRTEKNGKNNASFFEKKDSKYSLLQDVYGGSEIKSIVLAYETES